MRATKTDLSSVFSHPSLPGAVYCEGVSADAVAAVFGTLSISYPVVVPVDERAALLSHFPLDALRFRPGDWARVTNGLYRGDLCIITAFNGYTNLDTREIEVWLVPRIPLPGLQRPRRRPTPKLFDPELVRAHYGQASVVRVNQGYTFRRRWYQHGLTTVMLTPKALRQAWPRNPQELSAFSESAAFYPLSVCSDSLREAMRHFHQQSPRIHIGDRVEIRMGEQAGLVGFALNVESDRVEIAIQLEDTCFGGSNGGVQSLQVALTDVRLRINVGDHVSVLEGFHHGGLCGIVAVVDDDEVTIVVFVTHTEVSFHELLLLIAN